MALTIGEHLAQLQKEHVEALQSNDQDRVQSILVRYLELLNSAPRDSNILFLAGTCYLQLGYNGLAITLYEEVLRQQPKLAEVWNNLGSAWKAELKNKEAERCYRMAVKLNPNASDYYNNLCTLHINEGTAAQGLKDAERAIELNPDNARAHWNYSLLLLETGQWKKGFAEYDAGLLSMDRPNRAYGGADLYLGSHQPGDNIVVYGEQGLGDEVMYLSAMQDLIDDFGPENVIFDCHPRLEALVRRNFPGIEIHPTRKKNTLDWLAGRTIKYRVPIGSLFRWYRSEGNFPRKLYLTPDPVKVAKWRKKLEETGPGPYIGFGWAGGSKRTHSPARSFQLTPLKPLLDLPETLCGTFISLQYTPEAKEKLDRFHADTGIRVHHWPEAVEAFDYEETVALITALDLCILPNTTAVHVCGAVGTPCWTMTPDRCAWRYSNGDDHMVFYGEWVRQFREKGDWTPVIRKMTEQLHEFIYRGWRMDT